MKDDSSAIAAQAETAAPPWLLLIHRIPPKPDYFRVKVRRRLRHIGARPLKNSVYALPRTDEALEDLQWLAREIVADGGEALICEARFIEGISNQERASSSSRRAATGLSRAKCASTCTRLNSPTRAPIAPSRRCSIASACATARCARSARSCTTSTAKTRSSAAPRRPAWPSSWTGSPADTRRTPPGSSRQRSCSTPCTPTSSIDPSRHGSPPPPPPPDRAARPERPGRLFPAP